MKAVHLLFILGLISVQGAAAAPSPTEMKAQRLARSLLGHPLNPAIAKDKAILGAVIELIEQGQPKIAARVLTAQPDFFRETLRRFAIPRSRNSATERLDSFNPEIAHVVGGVRDAGNTGSFLDLYQCNDFYVVTDPECAATGDNAYNCVRDRKLDMSKPEVLARSPMTQDEKPSVLPDEDSAGIFTSEGEQTNNAGTGRRNLQMIVEKYLCKRLEYIQATRPNIENIRRDVERGEEFNTKCKKCHDVLDEASGAFSKIDFDGNAKFQRLRYSNTGVQNKTNINANVFPAGSAVSNNAWALNWTPEQIKDLGWEGQLSGYGVRSFMKSVITSGAFRSCVAQDVAKIVCPNKKISDEQLKMFGDKFKNEMNHNLRTLFETIASSQTCMGGGQ